MVHRNLIMPVNFLPIPTDPDGSCVVSDLSDVCEDVSVLNVAIEDSVTLPDFEPEDRTVSWVSELPAVSGDVVTDLIDVPSAVDFITADEHEQMEPCVLPVDIGGAASASDFQPVVSAPPAGTLTASPGSIFPCGLVCFLLGYKVHGFFVVFWYPACVLWWYWSQGINVCICMSGCNMYIGMFIQWLLEGFATLWHSNSSVIVTWLECLLSLI